MKILISAFALLYFSNINAQKQTFDITSFIALKGWKKQATESAVQFIKEDATKGTYCMITLMKAIPGTSNSKENFDAAWETVVKKMVTVSAAPEMQAPSKEDGWEAQSGYAPFQNEDNKGIALLVTTSGYQKMVNILILTNTDAYEKEITAFLESVSFQKQQQAQKETKQTTPAPVAVAAKGFTFSTTNFDDGWTATEETDWVKVTKGNITVLLHYAKEGTTNAADPEPHISTAWNILVAPRYSNLMNYRFASPSLDPQRAYIGAGYLTDNKTGKQVYVALFRKGNSNWVEFIAPDKNTFVSTFGTDVNNIGWDASSEIWLPLLEMMKYNKFAVALPDLTGKWVSWSGSNIQYVNVYTGLDAGMGHAQSGNEIIFNANGSYSREYKGVSGSPGNGNRFYGEKNNGKVIVSNWEIKLTNSFKGETHTFSAQFEAIKGGRILHLWRGNIEEMLLYREK